MQVGDQDDDQLWLGNRNDGTTGLRNAAGITDYSGRPASYDWNPSSYRRYGAETRSGPPAVSSAGFTSQPLDGQQYQPGEIHWAVYRRNLDGSEPRYYLSNAPEDTPLETLAYVGGSRWRIETEVETEKSDVGLDEYETRTPYQVRGRLWAGWHHHVALCLLGGAFLLSLQQAWGGNDAPDNCRRLAKRSRLTGQR